MIEVVFSFMYFAIAIYVFIKLSEYYKNKNTDGDPDGIDALSALFFAVFWVVWLPWFLIFKKQLTFTTLHDMIDITKEIYNDQTHTFNR